MILSQPLAHAARLCAHIAGDTVTGVVEDVWFVDTELGEHVCREKKCRSSSGLHVVRANNSSCGLYGCGPR